MHKFEELSGKVQRRWDRSSLSSKRTGEWGLLKQVVFAEREEVIKLLTSQPYEALAGKVELAAKELYVKQEKFVIAVGEGTDRSRFSFATENLVEKMQQEFLLLRKEPEFIDKTPQEIITTPGQKQALLRLYHRTLVSAVYGMAEAYVYSISADEELPERFEKMKPQDIVNEIILGEPKNGAEPLIFNLMSWADPENIALKKIYLRGKIIGAIVDRLRKGKEEEIEFLTNQDLSNVPFVTRAEEKDRGDDYYERFEGFVNDVIERAMSANGALSPKQKELLNIMLEMQKEREDKTFPTPSEIANRLGCSDENIGQRLGRIAATIITKYDVDRDIIARNFGLPVRAVRALERIARSGIAREE